MSQGIAHSIVLHDVQNPRNQLCSITITVLHGPVEVSLGTSTYNTVGTKNDSELKNGIIACLHLSDS